MSGETERDESGWTVDTLNYFFQKQLDNLRNLLDERHDAQSVAMQTAFAAAEKAVDQRAATLDREFHEHLDQVRHENALAFVNSDKAIAAALASAKEAVTKSEVSTDKRFDSVNERFETVNNFRGQLADQALTFVGKDEYNASQHRLDEKVDELKKQLDEVKQATIHNDGRHLGGVALGGWVIGGVSAVVSIILLVNTLTKAS